MGDVVALRVQRRTSDQEDAG